MKLTGIIVATLALSTSAFAGSNYDYSCVFSGNTYVKVRPNGKKLVIKNDQGDSAKFRIKSIGAHGSIDLDGGLSHGTTTLILEGSAGKLSYSYDIEGGERSEKGKALKATLSLENFEDKSGVCIKHF